MALMAGGRGCQDDLYPVRLAELLAVGCQTPFISQQPVPALMLLSDPRL
jgi:hypothetical protein